MLYSGWRATWSIHAVHAYLRSNVLEAFHSHVFKEGNQLVQLSIRLVMIPTPNVNTIVWLGHEVLLDVVNDDCSIEVSPKLGEVFDIDTISKLCLVTVKSMGDEALPIKIIKDPICIVFQASGEHYKLKMVIELTKES